MKVNKLIWMALAILLGVGTGTAGAATNEVSALLQQGLFEEEANQNLDAAIQAYQSVIAQTEKNRQFAATAVFRLGECYRKQGKTNEAAAQYQRILRDFTDQPELAKLSRQYLAGMGSSAPGPVPLPVLPSLGVSPEAHLLEGQISAIESMKSEPELQARGVLATFPDETLKKMLVNLPRLQDQEARLKANPKLAYNDLGGYRIAIAPDPELAQLERHSTNLLTDAQRELSTQLLWIGERVNFIMDNQKARLNVLQLAGGASGAPAISDAALQTQKQLLDEEIKLVDQQLQSQQAKVKTGVLAPDELSSTQMKLLELERQRAALDSGQLISPQATPQPGDEDKELQRIQSMIKDNPDLINGQSGNNIPLIDAASANRLAVAKFLLENGADVNIRRQSDGRTALNEAAEHGYKGMAELLLDHGADANETRPNFTDRLPPLILAAQHGFKAVAEVLLAHKADVNVRASGGETPLHVAVANGFMAVAELLLSHGADINARTTTGQTPLHLAAAAGNTTVIGWLIAHKAEVDAKDNYGVTPLFAAVRAGQIDAASLFLKNKADVNVQAKGGAGDFGTGWTPLHVALAKNYGGLGEMVKLLLENNARTDAQIPVYSFDFNQNRGYAAHHPGNKQFGDAENIAPLAMAVLSGQQEVVRLLIEHHADVNAKDTAAESPLILAAAIDHGNGAGGEIRDRLAIAELLVASGADVNAQNNEHAPALTLAVNNNSPAMVKLILAHRPKVDVIDKDGCTPLQRAVQQQRPDIAGMLLEAGADPDVKYPQSAGSWVGYGALEASVQLGNEPLVQALLAHKANPNAQDSSGRTPLSEAKRLESDPAHPQVMGEIVELLRNAGANENLRRLSTISVSRGGDERIGFARVPNLPNHFSLLDLITGFYAPPFRAATRNGTTIQELPGLAFPDFGRIKIFRLQKDGRTNAISVDLNQQFASGDCSKDVALEWGDMVEIPEADHNINETWPGLSSQVTATLQKCAAAQVAIVVKGQTNLVALKPVMYRRSSPSNPGGSPGGLVGYGMPGFGGDGPIYYGDRMVGPNGFTPFIGEVNPGGGPRGQSSFWLYDVVHDANVILTSSDLSRVKITRKDMTTRKTVEMTFDLQKDDPANALWLRDGDVIELPEKP